MRTIKLQMVLLYILPLNFVSIGTTFIWVNIVSHRYDCCWKTTMLYSCTDFAVFHNKDSNILGLALPPHTYFPLILFLCLFFLYIYICITL